MIGYKASYNGRCINITYEVGKTYTYNGKLEMCNSGFHFCKEPKDALQHYDIDNPGFQLFKIEALGKVINKGNKSVTDKIKILEIVPESEYGELLGTVYDDRGNKIKYIDDDGDVFQWEYDDRNNLIKEIDFDGDIYQYEYYENGSKAKKILNGETIWSIDIKK